MAKKILGSGAPAITEIHKLIDLDALYQNGTKLVSKEQNEVIVEIKGQEIVYRLKHQHNSFRVNLEIHINGLPYWTGISAEEGGGFWHELYRWAGNVQSEEFDRRRSEMVSLITYLID